MQIWKGGHGTKGKSSSASLHCQKLEAHHPGVSTANTVEASSSHLQLVHLIQATGHLGLLPLPFEIAFMFPFRKKKKCVKNGVEGTKRREKLMWEWKENIIFLAPIHLESAGNPHLKSLCIFCLFVFYFLV